MTSPAEYTPPQGLKYPQPAIDPNPAWEDVRQEYSTPYPLNEIPVCVERPVKSQALPAKYGVGRTFNITTVALNSNPPEVIAASPTIQRAILVAGGAGVIVGTAEQVKAGSPDGFTLPNGTPVTWTGFREPLYAVIAAAGTPTTLSVRLEFWAD